MEIFLEFLKYGAIGIAMVLVVLSYRLLSKEQEKDVVREPMLKSIRTYFLLALAMTLFFGITEIVSLAMSSNISTSDTDTTKDELRAYLDEEVPENAPHDSDKVIRTIEDYIQQASKYTSLQLNFSQVDSLNDQLSIAKTAAEDRLFNTAVTCLEILVNNDHETFINIDFRGSEKTDHYDMLEIILQHEDKLLTSIENRRKRIRDSWVEFKKTYWLGEDNNELFYIIPSDISSLKKL